MLHLIFFIILSSIAPFALSSTLSPPQTLIDDDRQTLISPNQNFALSFFSPWNSTNRYIGIWFNNVPQLTPVWIANRDNPLTDTSGVLTITPSGNITITSNDTGVVFWSSNSSITNPVGNIVLQLLDDGNLVVTDDSRNYIWQSFENPTNTLIPGMKLGWNLETNQEWYLTSWRNSQDPASGEYTYRMDRRGLPQIVLRQRSEIDYRSGPWDGVRFGGGLELQENAIFNPIMVFNSTQMYYSFENVDESTISRFVVNETGEIKHISWNERRNEWVDVLKIQEDTCDNYNICGPYGICNMNTEPICTCPRGFSPSFLSDWERLDPAGGCVRNVPLNCSVVQEGFRRLTNHKLPDASLFFINETATDPDRCREACLMNCTCTAYAKTEASGCVVWFGDLVDIREYTEGGQELYIRMDVSELGSGSNKRRKAIIASVSVISVILFVGLISCYVYRKKVAAMKIRDLSAQREHSARQNNTELIEKEDLELPSFEFYIISNATNNFSSSNKIGQGGFGPVYKGKLLTGEEIAVKRLAKDSGQGLAEFKNEVILYLKLQHRNLVRLLGCCIHGDERMLIYEYMPNKSLDLFIFKQTRGTSLDWEKRFDIIVGIARGLLYLHRDSRLRIIHRDLKASNILLDAEMNPKISDFGLARTFRGDISEENTSRIIGTYGYMSPEYAIDGLFSVKSDVFSFGVLVLEIISSRKNRGFFHPDHDLNLLGHAWKLWNEMKPIELVDVNMEGTKSELDVLRCIQVGLLCVQQRPENRPTMSSVLLMLDSENPVLPQPRQPGFYTERFQDTDTSTTGKCASVTNEVTVTLLQGR